MLLFVLLASLAPQAWAWWSLRGRILSGGLTRLGALVRYLAWALAPVAVLAGLFFAVVGLEEVSGAGLVPELVARAALPIAALLLAIAALGVLFFSVQVAVIRPRVSPKA